MGLFFQIEYHNIRKT